MENVTPNTPEEQASREVSKGEFFRTVALPRPALDWVTLGDFRDSQGHPLRNNLDFQALVEAVAKSREALDSICKIYRDWAAAGSRDATDEIDRMEEIAHSTLEDLSAPALAEAIKSAGGQK